MRAKELSIEVQARVVVTDEMAERCLRLLEMWQDDNANAKIIGERQPDGRTRFHLEVDKNEDD